METCHCGKPLHYSSEEIRRFVEDMIRAHGEYVPITVAGRRWKVQRHYLALHGIKGKEIHLLGFEELFDKPAENGTTVVVF